MSVEIVAEAYKWLPCGLQKFTINGQTADKDDFGYMDDTESENAEPYSCANKQFIRYDCPQEGVLEKYNITFEEYNEICDKLEEELYVGSCGLCV